MTMRIRTILTSVFLISGVMLLADTTQDGVQWMQSIGGGLSISAAVTLIYDAIEKAGKR